MWGDGWWRGGALYLLGDECTNDSIVYNYTAVHARSSWLVLSANRHHTLRHGTNLSN